MVTPAQDLFWVQVLASVESGQVMQCLVPQYPHGWLGARVGDEPQKGHTGPGNGGLFVALTHQHCPCSEQAGPCGPLCAGWPLKWSSHATVLCPSGARRLAIGGEGCSEGCSGGFFPGSDVQGRERRLPGPRASTGRRSRLGGATFQSLTHTSLQIVGRRGPSLCAPPGTLCVA